MTDPQPKRRPGDIILDRILSSNATAEERELGHQHLRLLAKVMIRVAKRRAEEQADADSRQAGLGSKMDS